MNVDLKAFENVRVIPLRVQIGVTPSGRTQFSEQFNVQDVY